MFTLLSFYFCESVRRHRRSRWLLRSWFAAGNSLAFVDSVTLSCNTTPLVRIKGPSIITFSSHLTAAENKRGNGNKLLLEVTREAVVLMGDTFCRL